MTSIERLRSAARRALRSSPGPGVLVLGMHRSGTSAATRIVNMLGLATCVPEDMVRGPWNPSGHWESRSLMHLDDRLLAEMGCAWWSPPPSGARYWEVAGRIVTTPSRARKEFRRVHPSGPWVWKDPRSALLLPFWRTALGSKIAAVIVYRNPLDVAASLQARHDLSLPESLALWERYNRLLLQHCAGLPAVVTRYDDLVSDPVGFGDALASFLEDQGIGVEVTAEDQLRGFVDEGLRHSAHSRSDVESRAPETLATYQALEAVIGPSPSFSSPEVPPEAPWVQLELDKRGPRERPDWRPPPGPGAEESPVPQPAPTLEKSSEISSEMTTPSNTGCA